MAQRDYQKKTRLGDLLKQRGVLRHDDLCAALDKQQRSGESLGAILVNGGLVSRGDLFRTLGRQRLLRLVSILGTLMLAPATAWSDSNYNQHSATATNGHTMPSADRPPIYEGDPISVPVKALVERWALGVTDSDYEARRFRYDIDTLGQGMAVRLRFKF